jgi:hypothetical protein
MEPILFLAAVGFFMTTVACFVWSLSLTGKVSRAQAETRQTQANLSKYSEEVKAWTEKELQEKAALKGEVDALSVYRGILDARAEADRILQVARAESDSLLREASSHRSQSQEEAKALRAKANQTLKDAQDKAESVVRSANQEAERILKSANIKADEVAGTAMEVVRDASRYEQVAKAMRNLIDGYGDQYVVPSRSLLDELAEEYGFAEAGIELTNARQRSRAMVKSHEAATCDYVEANRRDTAITFVVDAFNGKVDSILSRVKETNVGTLEQEIRDAFNLVNHNGSAFRNARINPNYLEARLTELRWAASVQALKLRDKEEQKRLQEQMREEARAQREFERSLREAEKEEETLRRAMEKIQDQVSKASEEQKHKYELQLAEMAERLRLAEERSERAKSMAEQTKKGHVYVISNVGSFGENVFKIGLTRRIDPTDRVDELSNASVPFPFDIHAMILSDDSPALEAALHRHFLGNRVNKVNARKEFFRVPMQELRTEIEKLGYQVGWTLAAQAKEYRETLAVERALAEDPSKGIEWLKSVGAEASTVESDETEIA